ncbi:MAG: molybdopterin-guanine dinucleotide biosynthesis protein B [Candidatus Hydrothermarchaeota archaeon]
MHKKRTPPVVSIVGRSGSGKTFLIEKLIKEFKKRGYKVGTIKHHFHKDFEIDIEGKDSWKHAKAGSDAVVISSPSKFAMVKKVEKEASLDHIIDNFLLDMDIVLTEGFTKENKPRIIILKKPEDLEIFSLGFEVLAVINEKGFSVPYPSFKFDETRLLVNFMIDRLKIE